MDLARIIQIYIVQLGIGGIYYFLIAWLILHRSATRENKIFSLFFINVACGTVVNVIYAPLMINPLVLILHLVTYYLLSFGQVFLLLFTLLLLKSQRIINTGMQVLIIFSFAVLLSGIFFLGLNGEVRIDNSTNWKPAWSLFFFLYAFCLCIFTCIIPTIYFSLKLRTRFENKLIRKRYGYFLIGIGFYYFVWGGTSLSNYLNNPTFRMIWSFISLACFISTYTIYHGIGKVL
ncbi:MAG: hypothetical protein ACTSU4_02040 [Promethearchaeota archaeon]